MKSMRADGEIYEGDNLAMLRSLPAYSVELIYIDPPFNTGKTRQKHTLATKRDDAGERVGFQGRRYKTETLATMTHQDSFADYLAFLRPRLEEAKRVLTPDGSLFVHLDYREAHYVKIMLDEIFGRDALMNEIIWAYDYGGRSKKRWPAKHDTIFWYARAPERCIFDYEAIDRIPYMAPGLAGAEKAAKGKVPTDVWWHTIVPTNSREKTGYPSQKPLGLLKRIIRVHSRKGSLVMDFFAGSGSFGEAAAQEGRRFILADNNPQAIKIMRRRLAAYKVRYCKIS